MIRDIKNMANWDEAARWLAKHGHGLEQIRLQKLEWELMQAPSTPEPVEKVVTSTPVAKVMPTPTAKVMPTSTTKIAPAKGTTTTPAPNSKK